MQHTEALQPSLVPGAKLETHLALICRYYEQSGLSRAELPEDVTEMVSLCCGPETVAGSLSRSCCSGKVPDPWKCWPVLRSHKSRPRDGNSSACSERD